MRTAQEIRSELIKLDHLPYDPIRQETIERANDLEREILLEQLDSLYKRKHRAKK